MSYELKMVEKFILDYKECLLAIEESYKSLNDERLGSIVKRAFKADVVELFKLMEQYTTFSLKLLKVSVSEMTVGDSFVYCSNLGIVCKSFSNNSRRYKIIRDKYSHSYGKPELKDFISFYENTKDVLYEQYNLMVKRFKELKGSDSASFHRVDF